MKIDFPNSLIGSFAFPEVLYSATRVEKDRYKNVGVPFIRVVKASRENKMGKDAKMQLMHVQTCVRSVKHSACHVPSSYSKHQILRKKSNCSNPERVT